jgi:hypothetical protein
LTGQFSPWPCDPPRSKAELIEVSDVGYDMFRSNYIPTYPDQVHKTPLSSKDSIDRAIDILRATVHPDIEVIQ